MPFLWLWYPQQSSLVYIKQNISFNCILLQFCIRILFLIFAVYITKQCGKSVNISEQNFVELSPATRPRITNTTCRLNFAPFSPNSNDSGLVLTIEYIRLSSKTSGACLDNRINIYDGTEKLSKFINDFSTLLSPDNQRFITPAWLFLFVRVPITWDETPRTILKGCFFRHFFTTCCLLTIACNHNLR